jgi:hypothetical protein
VLALTIGLEKQKVEQLNKLEPTQNLLKREKNRKSDAVLMTIGLEFFP